MKQMICFFFLFLVGVFENNAQEVYVTSVNSQRVKSLQVNVNGEFISNPVISLHGEKQLEVNFDVLGDGYTRYAYSIVHCNADWTPSFILPMEYMSGFQGTTIDDFANSMATTTAYANYRFFLPNEDVRFKLSGNYVVKVYDESEPDKILFTACFYVTESLVAINTKISGNTDIDVNKNHQQLEFSIDHKNFPIPHPLTDMKIYVYQNDRRDNCVTDLKPSSILQNQLVYSHSRELIFKAGNEYRRMEFLSDRYNGMHVENVQFHNPFYHMTLYPDQKRNGFSYQYDQDQNGRFFIRCSDCNDPDTEADYYIVHFTLEEDEIAGGNVYLNGQFLYNNFNEESRMEYNREAGQYEKSLLLKAGSYNYQYLFVPDRETTGLTFPVEGDFAETENEYTIAVYYRPIGARYDRLIGFQKAQNRMTVF
jgi:hypothetical protein